MDTWGKVRIHGSGNVQFGKYCSLANNINIYVGVREEDPFFLCLRRSRPTGIGSDVVIGNDVWIGDNVTIMGGVKVGDGAVLASNSRIVKDVYPYTVVGGNPAKCLKKRFSDAEIARLSALRWWDWGEASIVQLAPILRSGQIEQFLLNGGGATAAGGDDASFRPCEEHP